MTSLREATATIKRSTGSINRPSFGDSETFPCYWETTSQIVTGPDGNEIKSIAYGDFALSSGLKRGDKIVSVVQNGYNLLTVETILKEIGQYPNFDRLEVFI